MSRVISNPRQYTLVVRNAVGGIIRRVSLLQKNIFGATPTGLGIEFDRSYFSNNGSHHNYDTEVKMAEMAFNVVIGAESDPYGTQHRFVNDLNGNLSLEYWAQGLPHTFSRDVAIKSIGHGEVDLNGVINMSLVLECLTPWFNWTLSTGMHDSQTDTVTHFIENNSMYLNKKRLAPLLIEIDNFTTTPFVNPHYIMHGGVNYSEVLGQFRWIGTIPVNHTLIMSTDTVNGRCVLRNNANNIEIDVSNQLDIRFLNYLMAPSGMTRFDPQVAGLGQITTIRYKHERLMI